MLRSATGLKETLWSAERAEDQRGTRGHTGPPRSHKYTHGSVGPAWEQHIFKTITLMTKIDCTDPPPKKTLTHKKTKP